jgi:acetyl-CoA carboxylase biotin carboxyl carrier protein
MSEDAMAEAARATDAPPPPDATDAPAQANVTPDPAGPGVTPDDLATHGASAGADASLLALVDRLAGILERSDLLELEVEAGGTGLVLRKPEALAPVAALQPASSRAGSTSSADRGDTADAASSMAEPPGRPSVKAPLTGIWYSAPAPGSGPFVEVGREVAAGQVIGLIEAMKLFNEIKSDLAGRVVKVAVENGQLVKAKQVLIEVEPL